MKALTCILSVLLAGVIVLLVLFNGNSSSTSHVSSLSNQSIDLAVPVSLENDESSVPVIEKYAFNMTQDYIRELLGVPHDTDKSSDIYFNVLYFGISGHLIFNYSEGNLHGVYWESPSGLSVDVANNIFNTVSNYYDNKIGSGDDIKYVLRDDSGSFFEWIDSFNKTEYMLEFVADGSGNKVLYGFFKMIDFDFSQVDIDAIQNALESLDN